MPGIFLFCTCEVLYQLLIVSINGRQFAQTKCHKMSGFSFGSGSVKKKTKNRTVNFSLRCLSNFGTNLRTFTNLVIFRVRVLQGTISNVSNRKSVIVVPK